MDSSLKLRIIKSMNWMVKTLRWRADENRNNIEPDSHGGYSPELQEAIDLLEELENGSK